MENPYAQPPPAPANPYAPPSNPYAPPSAPISTPTGEGQFNFYTVGPLKFVLLALTTFGIFVLYWFYKNWDVIRQRENEAIWPFWRAVFTGLWTFSMGGRFHAYAAQRGFSLEFPYVPIGIAFLVANIAARADGPLAFLSYVGFLIVIPFDFAARRLNGGGQLAEPTYGSFSALNVVWIIVGGILLLFALLGIFIGDEF